MTSEQPTDTHAIKNTLSTLPWTLIVPLAALGLIRTIPGIIGSEDPQWVSILVILLLPAVTAVWVSVVILMGVPNPFITLVFTGETYGILAIALNITIQGDFSKLSVIGVVAILVVNLIWGALAGLIALVIRRRQT